MIKVIEEDFNTQRLINMRDMKAWQVAVVTDNGSSCNGEIVMRTASENQFEVISLSDPKENHSWTTPNGVKVRLLAPGESVTVQLSND